MSKSKPDLSSQRSSCQSQTSIRSGAHSYPIHRGKVPPHWQKAAQSKDFTIVARVIDRLHVLIRCHHCDGTQPKRINVVLNNIPECPHCIRKARTAQAKTVGATYLGVDPKSAQISVIKLACGHTVKRQHHRMKAAAEGGHALSCDICREARYKQEALRFDWELIGPARSGKHGYRQYRHSCGQLQDIMVGNMLWGDCKCSGCWTGRTAQPSFIYLFRIDLPDLPVIKLGYGVRPQKRLRHQLGIALTVPTEIIRTVPMPTGHLARQEEERCHRTLKQEYPEWAIPKAAYGDAINTASEIYNPAAEPTIHAMLDDIEDRLGNSNEDIPE